VPAYLLKSDPSRYSFADLVREGHTTYRATAEPRALAHVRAMRRGDLVAIYHTGREKQVVGIAEVARDAYDVPSPTVDLTPKRPLAHPVTLDDFRNDPVLQSCELLQRPRLSVLPLTDAQLRRLLAASASPVGHAR
jgi:predicted RNA-binding protein with PUA-like domain